MAQGDYIEGDDVQNFLDYKYVRLRQKLTVFHVFVWISILNYDDLIS